MKHSKNRPLAPKGGNDNVMTPEPLAKLIIDHYKPSGLILEPCRGSGVFYNLLKTCGEVDWCEIVEGRDFLALESDKKYDWIVTNPPWSQIHPFLNKSMELADNVVFLCLINAFFMRARLHDIRSHGFSIREILEVPQPKMNWPQTGFALGAIHISKGENEYIKFERYAHEKMPYM